MAPTAIPPEAVSALIADFDHIGWWEAFLLLLIFLSTLVVIAVLGVHPISPIPCMLIDPYLSLALCLSFCSPPNRWLVADISCY
jgi:hypothetical protein